LKIVLPGFDLPAADLFVYYPSKRNQTIRARAFIDFLVEHFRAPQGQQGSRGKGRERKDKPA
jgi:DNA-binding transcriptional LysR family regulator